MRTTLCSNIPSLTVVESNGVTVKSPNVISKTNRQYTQVGDWSFARHRECCVCEEPRVRGHQVLGGSQKERGERRVGSKV